MGRYALLVGISNYSSDRSLAALPKAVLDVEALREVLIDPEIGGFEESAVKVLQDVERGAIEAAIYELFDKRRPEDLVLFYFSGHGVVDDRDKFYLTGSTTQTNSLPPTAVSSKYIHDEMNGSRSQHQVIILDCCNSGAFPDGMKSKGVVTVDPKLGGEGKVILTASDSSQYAFEQEGFELSLYTHFLVEGLKTGVADKDEDGHVSVNEIHSYVEEKVKSVNDRMTPKFYGFMKDGQPIYLAKAVQDNSLKFRKEVEELAKESNGEISIFAKNYLELQQQKLGIDQLEAETIISEVLHPYQEYAKKLVAYEQSLQQEAFPFSEVAQAHLQKYEASLGLRPEDLQEIKDRIIAPKQAEYDQQLQEVQRQREAENLRFQQQKAEELRQQQAAETARLKRQREEAERARQLEILLAAESLKRQQQRPVQPEFEFEFVKVQVVKERGILGIVGGTKLELERKQGKAQYISEDLGNGITLDLVRIPAGELTMGMPPAERQIALDNALKYGVEKEDAEKYMDWSTPPHKVTIKEAFLMGKYTVTNTLWKAVMGTEPSKQCGVEFQGDNQPVVGVSWHDCNKFCKELSVLIGKEFRLPTEAEWEYVCRAKTTTPFHFGETITPALVNYNGNSPYANAPKGEYREKTVDVGSFSPNAWGLYQMHGNVWEWCLDEWHDSYNSKPQILRDNGSEPWGEIRVDDNDNRFRLLCGGSWYNYAGVCRSACRVSYVAYDQFSNFGFRVVCRLQ